MDRVFYILGSLLAASGVAAGAFGAHSLRGRLPPEMLAVFETGVRYQLIHALALLAAGWAATRWSASVACAAGWCFLVGSLLFSGSLYAMALGGNRALGAITPLGGGAFILGWLALAWAAWRGR